MLKTVNHVEIDDLISLVATRAKVSSRVIIPFTDFTNHLTELLKFHDDLSSQFVCAGPVLPEVAIATDRANLKLVEITPTSPFTVDIEALLEAIESPGDLIYIANPNRVSGATLSLENLEQLARSVPEGMLIIDEYFYDFFGISGQSLLDIFNNIIVLRSFTAALSINNAEAGFTLSDTETARRIREFIPADNFSTTIRKTIQATLINDDAVNTRLEEIHEESLRVATALTRMGIQCRITAGDFLLLRVASPTLVGNSLASFKIPVVNVDGYPRMTHYLRYQLQSPLSNDQLLFAFEKMPDEHYKMKRLDTKAQILHRTGETIKKPADVMLNRLKSYKRVAKTTTRKTTGKRKVRA